MIYELWLQKNSSHSNTALKRLPEETKQEWDNLFSDEGMAKFGAKCLLYCNCAWSNEEYSHWGVVTYESIQGRIEQTKAIEKAGWYEYADMFSVLGTLTDQPGTVTYPNPIHQLFMVRTNPVTLANMTRLTKEEQDALWASWNDSMTRTKGVITLFCKCYWASEDYASFGIATFPDIEALQGHHDDLEKLNWPLYFSAFTLPGIAG